MMRQIYYNILMLLRGRGNNVTKTISLTLGLLIGILLFACVAFQLSYNHFFRQSEQLYLAYMTDAKGGGYSLYGTFAKAMRENFPNEVEDATVMRDNGVQVYYSGKNRLQGQTIWADWNLFSTLGVKVLAGKSEDLQIADAIFISRSVADKIREGGELSSVIGKQLYLNRNTPFTIWGVFEDLPQNVDFPFDIVNSMNDLWKDNRAGWGGDYSYKSIIRFSNPQRDVVEVERRLPELMKKYMPDFNKDPQKCRAIVFRPLTDYHAQNTTANTMIVVMTVLALAILLIVAFNYILISVSSLTRRAKEVGIHKCSGAAGGTVFSMFLIETALIVLISVLLAGILMYLFRDFVEDVAAAPLMALFTVHNLWIPALVVVGVLLLAGVLPAWLFSSVPVTQVFRRYSQHNIWWKRPLLFIQFAGVAFIFGFLLVVLLQYRMVLERPLGYDPTRVVTCRVTVKDAYENRMALFRNLPMVEDYTYANMLICGGYGTEPFEIGEDNKVSARLNLVARNFLPSLKIPLLEGANFTPTKKSGYWMSDNDELIVNETFLRQAGWTGGAVGRTIKFYGDPYTIVGVMKDHLISGVYNSQEAVALMFKESGGMHYVRLKEPFGENLSELNLKMQEIFPTDDVVFTSLEQTLDEQYTDVRRFRNAVILASISVFIIALMGLLGYVNDEVCRRSKEIAIRKVNGAESRDIIRLLTRDITWVAVPAIALGCTLASIFGNRWLDSFVEQAHISLVAFVMVAVLLLVVIAICIVLRTRNIAHENPVKSIKSE